MMFQRHNHLAMMSYLQSLFLILALIAVSFASPSISTKFSDCSPKEFPCGGHNCNISYPFRTPDMPKYCGYPKFELARIKDSSLLAINFTGELYEVQGIDYGNQHIHIASLDLVGQSCPHKLSSTIINFSLFNYTSSDYNVTVYIDCSIPPPSPDFTPIDCPVNNSRGPYSYYSLTKDGSPLWVELSGKCSLITVIPLYVESINKLKNQQITFVDAVREGFELSWVVGSWWCNKCNDSGGICGYNENSPDAPTCFCPDGRTTPGTCLKVYIHAW